MKAFTVRLRPLAVFALALAAFTGCSSTDGGGGGSVSGSVYYGVGFYDPWYYGDYYDDVDIVVTPPDTKPPDRPTAPPKPTHPIAPTPSPRPTQTPMPSIPRTPMPRASFRR
jgi:hypothetical protein